VHRWVTVFGRVNHLGAESGTLPTQPESALCTDWNEYLAKAGGINRHIAWYTNPYPTSRSVRSMPGWWLASGDQCRLTGSSSAWEACSRRCAIQMASCTLFYFTLHTLSRHVAITITRRSKRVNTVSVPGQISTPRWLHVAKDINRHVAFDLAATCNARM